MKKLSVISPAFNEEKNLPAVHSELVPALEGLGMDWEWIIIDDHSTDKTPDVIKRLCESDSRIKGLRMAENQGSHALCLFGLSKARGDCAVLLASDGQDSPENIGRLAGEMKKSGNKVAWLTREEGREDPFFKRFAAWGFYFLMRRVMGISSIPPGGGDMVLVDGAVLERLREIKRKNINVLVAIAELGFSQSYVAGQRRARVHGKTNFTFAKNIGLFFDTLTTLNSAAPLRRMTLPGFLTALTGFAAFSYGINF
ncbi:MAG: glycosyltransferase [Candidatus Mycalebacterium zealandia]|nr:MAG: glycosyltransferase [Candidatus Mycalebacterium zealandia]